MSIELTDEQGRALQAELGKPVDVVDPATHERYVLLAHEQYERVRSLLDQPHPTTPAESRAQIAPLMLRSQKAFWHDLPEILNLKSKKCQWVGYHGDERVGFGKTQTEVYQECFRRGLQRGDFYVGKIEEDETPPWGTLEGDWSLYEVTEGKDEDVPPRVV